MKKSKTKKKKIEFTLTLRNNIITKMKTMMIFMTIKGLNKLNVYNIFIFIKNYFFFKLKKDNNEEVIQ